MAAVHTSGSVTLTGGGQKDKVTPCVSPENVGQIPFSSRCTHFFLWVGVAHKPRSQKANMVWWVENIFGFSTHGSSELLNETFYSWLKYFVENIIVNQTFIKVQ